MDNSNHFKEWEEVKTLLFELKSSELIQNSVSEDVDIIENRICFILDQYQEQSNLLDSHLEYMVTALFSIVDNETKKLSNNIRSIDLSADEIKLNKKIHQAFRLVYHLAKVRNYKVIVKFFGHSVTDMAYALKLLKHNETQNWQTAYVLLLWLSITSLIPFDMSIVQDVNLIDALYAFGINYLTMSDKTSDAASVLLGRFLTRRDTSKIYMEKFLTFCKTQIPGEKYINGMKISHQMNGVLKGFGMILKFAPRDVIMPHLSTIYEIIMLYSKHPLCIRSSIARKLVTKVAGRIALSILPYSPPAWRYARGARSLTQTLMNFKGKQQQSTEKGSIAQANLQPPQSQQHHKSSTTPLKWHEVPEDIDNVVDHLLIDLTDTDTIVRWCAAKALGRITERLPVEFGQDIIDSILELFSSFTSHTGWHGGCLAFAELARRGLLLPNKLALIVPFIIRALVYEYIVGDFRVGGHVRDAACYVCWAFARAYDPVVLKPFVKQIACQLLIVVCWDREGTCRRAASAAFQEHVGRQGSFEHGIDIVTIADYVTVSQRENAFLKVAPTIVAFDCYAIPLVSHGVNVSLFHWDITIRKLCAQSLGKMVSIIPDLFCGQIFSQLLQECTSYNLFVRHGAFLAIGEILLSAQLQQLSWEFPIKDLADKIQEFIKEEDLYDGPGTELIRVALLNVIKVLSHWTLCDEAISSFDSVIDENLFYDCEEVQVAAVNCLESFSTILRPDRNKAKILFYLDKLKTNKLGFVQRGLTSALSRVTISDKEIFAHITTALFSTMRTLKDSEARRNSCLSLGQLIDVYGFPTAEKDDRFVVPLSYLKDFTHSFVNGMCDYRTDHRGDVGSWVREGSCRGTATIFASLSCCWSCEERKQVATISQLSPIIKIRKLLDDSSKACLKKLICYVLGTLGDRIDRTRLVAAETLYSILYDSPIVSRQLDDYDYLVEVFPKDNNKDDFNRNKWGQAENCFPLLVKLLDIDYYRNQILLSFINCVGGLTMSTATSATQNILDYLDDCTNEKYSSFCLSLIKLCESSVKKARIVPSMLKFLTMLFTNDCFDRLNDEVELREKVVQGILSFVQTTLTTVKQTPRIISCIKVLCFLPVSFPSSSAMAFSLVCDHLCHNSRDVRFSCAKEILENLDFYEEFDHRDEIETILTENDWSSSDLETLISQKEKLLRYFAII